MAEVLGMIGVNLAERTTGAGTGLDEGGLFKLGTRCRLDDGGEAIYVHAAAAITKFYAVAIDENFEAQHITNTIAKTGHMLGFAPDAAFADNDFGWVRTKGTNFTVKLMSACAADISLYTTATAGKLDDATSSGVRVDGLVAVTAASTTTDALAVEVIASN